MFKKIICLCVVSVMLFCLCACNINMENVAGLKRQIADLEEENFLMDERIAGLEAEKALLQQEIDALKAENTQQDERIAELEDWLFRLAKRLDELTDNGEWTNENALYAGVKEEYVNEVLEDVEGAFAYLDFKAVYITDKNANLVEKGSIYAPSYPYLNLLFVLYESVGKSCQEFAALLLLDERIDRVWDCYDLPFETIDTQYLDAPTYTIEVGETLDITLKGEYSRYYQPFGFEYIWIELADFDENKTYTPEDFPQVSLASVTKYDKLLYLYLSSPEYFNKIKAADILSRVASVDAVWVNVNRKPWEPLPPEDPPPPPEWIISDTTVAEIIERNWDDVTIVGLKSGTVTVSWYWWPDPRTVSCEITVVAKES